MPRITTQSPNHKPSKTTGSILSEVIDVADIEEDYIKMVIYGQNRVGKTTLACQFPKPLLLVSLEPNKTGGAASVKKMEGVKYLRVQESPKALQLAHELDSKNPFKTVVVDSATSYQDIILKEILNLEEVPEMLTWGMVSEEQYRQRSEKTRECLRPFLNLNCHVIVTAKEKNHNYPKESRKPTILQDVSSFELEPFFAADLGGATVGWLHDACDYIGRLSIEKEIKTVTRKVKIAGKESEQVEHRETGRFIRKLRTMYHPNYAAGFRSCNPSKVPEFIEDPTYAKIAAIIEGD